MKKIALKRHFAKNPVRNAIFTFWTEESGMRLRQPAPLMFPIGPTAGSFHENTTEQRHPRPPTGAHTLPPVGRASGRGGGRGMLIAGALHP